MTDILLRLADVSLHRGGRLLFEAMNLALQPGEALLVTGPNGCGKTSLLRLAAGLLEPSAGEIVRSPSALADDKAALDRELPLRSALAFWCGLSGTLDRIEEGLAAFGLSQLGEVPVRLLSTGQLKRATLARVAVSGARLWLLDEPLNGLDQSGAQLLGEAIEAHRSSGGAVLAASHLPLAGQWSNRDLTA